MNSNPVLGHGCYKKDFKEDFGNNLDRFGAKLNSQREVQRRCHKEDDKHDVSYHVGDIMMKIPSFYSKNDPYGYLEWVL